MAIVCLAKPSAIIGLQYVCLLFFGEASRPLVNLELEQTRLAALFVELQSLVNHVPQIIFADLILQKMQLPGPHGVDGDRHAWSRTDGK